LVDFGNQPVSSNFVSNTRTKQELFSFVLGQCDYCGVVQLVKLIPEKKLIPKYKWIDNKEPDKHAFVIAEALLSYVKCPDTRILFLSKYDKKVFDIVKEKIGTQAYLLDPALDLEINQTNPSQILIQERINSRFLSKLSKKIGKFDLILTCRMLEHAHKANSFILGLNEMLKKCGRIVIEVPDSTKPLLQGDVAMLWDEHTSYFTPESLRYCFRLFGYKLIKHISYHYPQEDALISIFQQSRSDRSQSNLVESSFPKPLGEKEIANIYAKKVQKISATISSCLKELKKQHGEIALFGAGHRAIMFVNLLHINNQYISYVVDDDPNKLGLKLPRSELEIQDSRVISKGFKGAIILAVGIEVEEKIVKILESKSKEKLHFFSLSPDSNYALSVFEHSRQYK